MITIKGSYVGNRRDGEEAVDFFRRGLIKSPFKTVPLKELGEVFDMMSKFFRSFLLRLLKDGLVLIYTNSYNRTR